MKATHQGTCQVCGRLQKLPGGNLSKHGYSVKWNMFVGECPGTGYKPFEVSCDRIQLSIDNVKAQIARVEKGIVEMMAEPVGYVAPFDAYRSKVTNRFERTGYYESTVTLTLDERGYPQLTHERDDTMRKTESAITYSGMPRTIPEIVVYLRKRKEERDRQWIAKRQEYVNWQQRRIDEWKPGKLTPVKEGK